MYDEVKQYYGLELKTSADLKTDACCTDADTPDWLKTVLGDIHPEVSAKYYGCGLVAPAEIKGLSILDLGSGSGRDCYALSRLVGEKGNIVGVDMTVEQLAVAREHIDYHTEKFGYAKANVEFKEGYIEKLDELGLKNDSFDLVVSNCVINLSPDKEAVLKQAYNLLKKGGEVYFSDVYSDRRVPDNIKNDPVLYGECLGGALYWNDFITLAKKVGFSDPRLVEDRPLSIDKAELEDMLGNTKFFSATYRLFKLDGLEPECEDYGQAVIYKGTIEHHEHSFLLDKHHDIEKGRVFPVCGNTWSMLKETRFEKHFEFISAGDEHLGIFEGCGSDLPFDTNSSSGGDSSGGSCC